MEISDKNFEYNYLLLGWQDQVQNPKLSWFHDTGAWFLLITEPVDVLSWFSKEKKYLLKNSEKQKKKASSSFQFLILEGLLFLILWLFY